jgi:hypothetical protein
MAVWNRTQNCLSYAFADFSDRAYWKQQPGYYAGLYRKGQTTNFTCPLVHERLIADNGHDTYSTDCKKSTCPAGFHKIGLAVAPGDDYHFFREDAPGQWSHKTGRGFVYGMTVKPWDSPRYFSNKHYKDWCGCYCTMTDGKLGPL